jgi:hypothetical protein
MLLSIESMPSGEALIALKKIEIFSQNLLNFGNNIN